jgi:serine/threonine protein kinase
VAFYANSDPVREALSGAPLERTVEAIASYAETLARLHAEHAVAHRDIKPRNLMYRGDRWLLADFGLVTCPTGLS